MPNSESGTSRFQSSDLGLRRTPGKAILRFREIFRCRRPRAERFTIISDLLKGKHKVINEQRNRKQNSSANFLKTDGGKTKSNAIEIPSISLPKGGGAIKGIDEKFSVNAVNGTASFSIPLPFSPARGASPALSLSYNSGAGNGVFGLGWALSLPSIKRKTDKELPQYLDEMIRTPSFFPRPKTLFRNSKKSRTAVSA